MGAAAAGVGGLLGGISGALSNQKEGGTTAGNYFTMGPGFNPGADVDLASNAGQRFLERIDQSDTNLEVQQNPILSGLYGKDGALNDTLGQVKDLESKGYSLQPEDFEAYGQASGNIARQFGQNEQSLSQALTDRGLDSSGVAGQAFSGSLGNKNEQLANLQTQIAQRRMDMNQQRLNSARGFAAQLGQGAQNAINSEFNQEQTRAEDVLRAGQSAGNYLGLAQGQANENLAQNQQTSHSSNLSNAISGGMSGAGTGLSMFGTFNKMNQGQPSMSGSSSPGGSIGGSVGGSL